MINLWFVINNLYNQEYRNILNNFGKFRSNTCVFNSAKTWQIGHGHKGKQTDAKLFHNNIEERVKKDLYPMFINIRSFLNVYFI